MFWDWLKKLRRPASSKRPRQRRDRFRLCLFDILEDRVLLSAFVVTSNADSGPGTLRDAIIKSNHATGGQNTITFEFSSSVPIVATPGTILINTGGASEPVVMPSQIGVIEPLTQLPDITNPVAINGLVSTTSLLPIPGVEIRGDHCTGSNNEGLSIHANDCDISGLIITAFSGGGISLYNSSGCDIASNYIGLATNGSNSGGNLTGIALHASTGNLITSNIIADNQNVGILLRGASNGNTLQSNEVLETLQGIGIDVEGSDSNVIGGAAPSDGNGVANNGYGLWIHPSATFPDASNNRVLNNRIVDNQNDGVRENGTNNVIYANVISGSPYGVVLSAGAYDQLLNNFIGTNAGGSAVTAPDGSSLGNSYFGVVIESNNNTISGNVISGTNPTGQTGLDGADPGSLFPDVVVTAAAMILYGQNATGNAISGNMIGTDATGEVVLGNQSEGIEVYYQAGSDTIENNVISGEKVASGPALYSGDGILLGDGAGDVTVLGNKIGIDAQGTHVLTNQGYGLYIDGSNNNTIGDTAGTDGNIISGNQAGGVLIANSSTGNQVVRNRIGTNATGTVALGNGANGDGVDIASASGNTIGGNSLGNLISGNSIGVISSSSQGQQPGSNNQVLGNYIGTNAAGTAALPNVIGVEIDGSSDNTIGGPSSALGNLISGNTGDGVDIANSATGNQVLGNFIGTDVSGSQRLGNGDAGVIINDSSINLIGGAAVGDGNVISANSGDGVLISGSQATGNHVEGNFIGFDVSAVQSLGNGGDGVAIVGGSTNLIGGAAALSGNFIGNSTLDGVYIDGSRSRSGADNNTVLGNYIGMGIVQGSGGNGGDGVAILFASSNVIGDPGSGNQIGNNSGNGVYIVSSTSHANLVQSNTIGDLNPNHGDGVLIDGAPSNTIGGTLSGAGNNISGNGQAGIHIKTASAANNAVQANTIDDSGTVGIWVEDTTGTQIGGDQTQHAGNVIAGNNDQGVFIAATASQTTVQGNTIEYDGIAGVSSAGNQSLIGGTASQGNAIVSNRGTGVAVIDNALGNAILSNSIASNQKLGIDLISANGSTPNHLQNYPVLTSVTSSNGTTSIAGTLNTTANTQVTIQYFANTFPDASGYGQGETYLGQTQVTTDGSGNASISGTFNVTLSPGTAISATATATDAQGLQNTSGFAKDVQIPALESQVNTLNAGQSANARIAMDAAGNYVVVWVSYSGPVYFRRFDVAGNARDPSDVLVANSDRPVDVAMDAAGDFVIVWSTGAQILARRFNADGTPKDAQPFAVSTLTVTGLDFQGGLGGGAAVAMDPNGDFVVAWEKGHYTDGYQVYARRYNAAGQAQDQQEFKVFDGVIGNENPGPSVAMDTNGDFVVLWNNIDSSGVSSLQAQRYSASATPQGSPVAVSSNAVEGIGSDVAMGPAGDFVVAWESADNTILAEPYTAAGQARTSQPIQINTPSDTYNPPYADSVELPAVVMNPATGGFTVTWTRAAVYGANTGAAIVARQFDANGNPLADDFIVNDIPAGLQENSDIAMSANGLDYAMAWEYRQGPNNTIPNIYERRLGPVPSPPNAYGQSINVEGGTSVAITLAGDDGNPGTTDTLTYALASNPAQGTLTGFTSATGAVTYTANANYKGADSFTFTIHDATTGLVSTTATVTLNVYQVTWSNPADITYGTALGAAQLNASANVPGTFSYTLADGSTPANGAVLHPGQNQVLNVTFTPSGTTGRTTTRQVSINVEPATLTITPSTNQAMFYGGTLPALTYTPTGFVNGDTVAVLSGNLSTVAVAGSPAGSYAFTLGSLTAGSNYTLQLAGNSPEFAVRPAPLTITPAPGQSMPYGADVPMLSYTPSGFVNGESALLLTGLLGTTATTESLVGIYAFTLGTLSAGSNYALQLAANPASFAVTPGPGGAIATDIPRFGWTPVAGADHYALKVTDVAGGQTVLNVAKVVTTTFGLTLAQALTPGRKYAWSVTPFAANGKAIAAASGNVSFQVLPLGPATPLAPNQPVATDMPTFSWTAQTDAGHTPGEQFTIEVTDQRTQQMLTVANVRGTSYALSANQALTPGHSYRWSVMAVSGNGQVRVPTSTSKNLTFSIAPIAAPVPGSSASISNTDMPTFTWSPVIDSLHTAPGSYVLTLATRSKGNVLTVNNLTGRSYTLTPSEALTPGQTYTWTITAVSTNGLVKVTSPRSTLTITPLAAPTLHSFTAPLTTDMPTLTWTPVTNAGTYGITLKDAHTGQSVLSIAHLGATSYTLTTAQALAPGHGYLWTVTAVSDNGQAMVSSGDSAFSVVALMAPTATGPSGTVTTDVPSFTWNSVPEAGHYNVSVKDGKTGQTVLTVANVSTTQLLLKPGQALKPGHNYTWSVTAVSTGGQATASSSSLSFSIPALVAPAPSAPSGQISTDQPTFSWSAVADGDHYSLRVTDTHTGLSLAVPDIVGTSFTLSPDRALTPGDNFVWSVAAVSASGRATASSGNLSFSIAPLAPPVLIGPDGTITTNTPTFVWRPVANARGYILRVSTGVGVYEPFVTTGTSYTLTPAQALSVGHTYTWYVIAVSTNLQVRSFSPLRTITIAS